MARLKATARPLGGPGDAARYGAGLLDAAAATAPGGPARSRRAAGRRRGERRADDHHRARRVVGDLVRDRAEQEPLGPGHALVADDDQVGGALLGDVEDRVGRVALARVDGDRDAGVAGHGRRLARASPRPPRAG